MISELLSKLQHPGPTFRGAPFFSWNARLDPEELRRQVRIFSEMGLGGFFMHPRTGMATPYLSDDFFACVEACMDEAKKCGLVPWMYDEDRWPSGKAGGLVTKRHAFRFRTLERYVLAVQPAPEKPLPPPPASSRDFTPIAWFVEVTDPDSPLDGLDTFGRPMYGTLRSYRRVAGPDVPLRDGERLVLFAVKVQEKHSWCNGQTELDTLNPAAVRAFIRKTHQIYNRHMRASKRNHIHLVACMII